VLRAVIEVGGRTETGMNAVPATGSNLAPEPTKS
jgi:hypothetical protein